MTENLKLMDDRSEREKFAESLLPGLAVDEILKRLGSAPGNELGSGKFLSPESSAALAANTFGFFLQHPSLFPSLPGLEDLRDSVLSVDLEATVRFPWRGGRHPCLDVLLRTGSAVIGIESKRFEPYRSAKSQMSFSRTYSRNVWGSRMARYEQMRDQLSDGAVCFEHLDAGQLVKHAFGLRSEAHRLGNGISSIAALVYLYAEPKEWPNKSRKTISSKTHVRHVEEIRKFEVAVTGDEVRFVPLSYRRLLESWASQRSEEVRAHARAIEGRFPDI